MTPQLRFPEFTDAWQVKRFGDVVKLRKNKFDPQKSIESRKDVELDNLATETGGILGYIDSRTQMSIKNVFQKDDILYGKLRPYLKKFAKAPWGGVSSSEIWAMYSDEIYSDYLLHLIQTKTFNDSVNIQSGSKMPRADWGLVSDTEYDMPSKPEQEKIADFLTAVDERIRLGEQKLAKLEQYKRGVMQKIFSQQVRFKDDNGNPYPDWEEKKLGEVSKIKTGDSDVQDAVADGEYPFFIRSKEVKRSNKYIYDGEAILIPGEGGIGEIFHYINGKFNYHQRVYKISDFDAKTHGKYVLYFIHQNFARQANKHSVKATVDSLRLPTFTDFSVSLPCKKEQQKIATFLTTLDDKITAEKSKLTAAKQFKKALLQRMFA